MSFENTADKGGNGFMDPGSNLSAGDGHTLGGAEIGIICGTVVIFIVLIVGLFYCRKTDILRKRRAAARRTMAGDEEGGVPMVDNPEMKSGEDGARSSGSPTDDQRGPRIFGSQPAPRTITASPTFNRRPGWGWMSLRSKRSGSGEFS